MYTWGRKQSKYLSIIKMASFVFCQRSKRSWGSFHQTESEPTLITARILMPTGFPLLVECGTVADAGSPGKRTTPFSTPETNRRFINQESSHTAPHISHIYIHVQAFISWPYILSVVIATSHFGRWSSVCNEIVLQQHYVWYLMQM